MQWSRPARVWRPSARKSSSAQRPPNGERPPAGSGRPVWQTERRFSKAHIHPAAVVAECVAGWGPARSQSSGDATEARSAVADAHRIALVERVVDKEGHLVVIVIV